MMWISVRSMGTQDAGGIPNFLTLPKVAESLDMTLTNTSIGFVTNPCHLIYFLVL